MKALASTIRTLTSLAARRWPALIIPLAGLVALLAVGATAIPHLSGVEPAADRVAETVFAAIQYQEEDGQPPLNRTRLSQLIRKAAEGGARFVAAPGIPPLHPQEAPFGRPEPIPGPTSEYFGKLARTLGIWLVLPLREADGQGGYYATSLLISPQGRPAQTYRQVMVRSGDATRGNFRDILDSFDVGGLRIGMMAGDDLQVGVPRLAARGAETVLVTAAWSGSDAAGWTHTCRQLSQRYAVNLVVADYRTPQHPEDGCGGIYTLDGSAAEPQSAAGGRLVRAALEGPPIPWRIDSALGLPSVVPVPTFEPPTPAMAELGRALFFDRDISSTGKVSCADCHRPELAFTDGRPKGEGVYGRRTKRNVPSLLNVAFRPLLRWDGYASSLENFAKYPISGFHEMNFHYLDELVDYVRSKPGYVEDFRSAMEAENIEFENIARALGAYQRSLISGGSRFDRYFYGGQESVLTESEKRGLELFRGKAACADCHLIGDRYALLMDFQYHFLGVGYDPRPGVSPDIGLGSISTNDEAGRFQTPSLRNVALTGPYMHDGSIKTLRETIEFFVRGGDAVEDKTLDISPVPLNEQDKTDLEAFLRTLTGSPRYDAQGRRQDASQTVPDKPSQSSPRQPSERKKHE
ncbi:MAG TPA: cytochrome c peroxidase [Acidobacteriota bacterium]|nr:cytochrome c peroxidase [Acidobacteriota bacterium]